VAQLPGGPQDQQGKRAVAGDQPDRHGPIPSRGGRRRVSRAAAESRRAEPT
jgi:hypothetical protein